MKIRYGYLGLGLILGLVVSLTIVFWPTNSEGPVPYTCAPFDHTRAELVYQNFIDHAVMRNHPECAYDSVTTNIKDGQSRTQFGTGAIQVLPFPSKIRGDRTLRVHGNPQRTWIMLFVQYFLADGDTYSMRLEMRKIGPNWFVDYWAPFPLQALNG